MKKRKCLGVNLTKYIQDVNEKNHKTLMKELKDLYKREDMPCPQIGRFSSVNMVVLPK